MGVHKYGGIVTGRREGGHLLAERGARRGWGWMEGLGGVRSPGDRALLALLSPEAVGVAGRLAEEERRELVSSGEMVAWRCRSAIASSSDGVGEGVGVGDGTGEG